MRLLKFDDRGELSLTRDLHDDFPRYAILSHTWGSDEDEITFADLIHGPDKRKAGYAKIQFCGEQARRDDLEYFWVDTCCINKANHAELAEAIVSMYRWYEGAAKCYVFLSDVSVRKRDIERTNRIWESAFPEKQMVYTRLDASRTTCSDNSQIFFEGGTIPG
jgi:Heterokaryon incompatibility protein (HET)